MGYFGETGRQGGMASTKHRKAEPCVKYNLVTSQVWYPLWCRMFAQTWSGGSSPPSGRNSGVSYGFIYVMGQLTR